MATATTLTPGTWAGDPIHSDISFKARHMGVGRVRGGLTLTSAELTVGAGGISESSVRAVIDAASVETGNEQRDAHVRSADFLDTETYPAIEFVSTEVREVDADTFTLVGELTLHGVTRTVELDAELIGVVDDPQGGERVGFSAVTRISRAEFGVDIQLVFGAGNAVVADSVEISIEIELTRTETSR